MYVPFPSVIIIGLVLSYVNDNDTNNNLASILTVNITRIKMVY